MMLMSKFKIKSKFKPAGDQPKTIEALVAGLRKGYAKQTLLGVTGSGKTFAVANVIEAVQKPTLVIAHNKTLAAQLAQEYRDFFPNNAVHYFVSYYDFYQPEAYMPITDTYIEKEAQINEEIDRLRHASTQALLTRKDVIIVATVSCIYGLGSPEEYEKENFVIKKGGRISRSDLIRKLVDIHYERNNIDMKSGNFRVIGNDFEIVPVNERLIYRIKMSNDEIARIEKIDLTTRAILERTNSLFLFPAKHFVTNDEKTALAIKSIREELTNRLKTLKKTGKILEAERLKRRTRYDLALIKEVGYCNGIENYSRHFSGKKEGEPPDTLLSYFPKKADGSADFLTIIDESHVTVPQIRGMYAGDASRKQSLVDHGFRLPSAKDNRPLKFEEFDKRVEDVIYTSATPASYEIENSSNIVEQIIRPTGLVDPEIRLFPVTEKKNFPGQIGHFILRAEEDIKKGGRVIATTLTKKMAEDLSEYLSKKQIKAKYLHSSIKTIERIEILTAFRKGEFDCLVGVNLLREGLDLPEVTLIGILDADREGFLRSETSLIQTIGRAARNVLGKVFIYADTITQSIKKAVNETSRRRKIQTEFNKKHKIVPRTIVKKITDITESMQNHHQKTVKILFDFDSDKFNKNPRKLIADKEREMNNAVKILDFETAAIVRDEIKLILSKLEKLKK